MDPLFMTLPRAVERVTMEFIRSPEKSSVEKITMITLNSLARLAKDVSIPDRQDLMIGITIKNFFNSNYQVIAERANGQMSSLKNSYSLLAGASYGKQNFHELIIALLREQLKLVEALNLIDKLNSREESKIIAYGVAKNLIQLVLETRTEKEDKKVQELLTGLSPDDKKWQEMLQDSFSQSPPNN